jgi:hypothetical protein
MPSLRDALTKSAGERVAAKMNQPKKKKAVTNTPGGGIMGATRALSGRKARLDEAIRRSGG